MKGDPRNIFDFTKPRIFNKRTIAGKTYRLYKQAFTKEYIELMIKELRELEVKCRFFKKGNASKKYSRATLFCVYILEEDTSKIPENFLDDFTIRFQKLMKERK